MLSYKKWKKMNENFSVNLGVKPPSKIDSLHSRWDEMGLPMKSKKSKKMFGGDDGPDMGSGPDDGLSGPPGKGGSPFMKKKGKKPFPPPDDMDDDDMGDEGPDDGDMDDDDMGDKGPMGDDDMGDEGPMGDDDDMGDKGPMGDDDMGDEGDDDMGDKGPMGDEDMGDEDMGDDDMGDGGPGVGGPDDVPAPKGKGKKGSFIDKTKAVADGAKLMHKGASKMIKGMKESAKCPECHKANCTCKDGDDEEVTPDGEMWSKKSKKSRKMTKEENEFFRSLQSQTGSVKFAKDEYGAWAPVVEDAIIPPTDPNANITQNDDEPGPGEVGHGVQGRIGSFNEWSQKFKRKSRNKSKRK